ncbi:MAG TPA: NDP-sugar synthase [Vicinamibacterales bacterium]|nr:NDP-sugar synthase [Vicinamibacterales bacterium]
MKAILLAGGRGTRLRPLTLHTPKPIVPMFDRPFLQYQIDLVRQVPEVDEIILSLNYQPRRIEEVFGDGADLGIRLRYVVEPTPLGTGGAIRFAAEGIRDEPVLVFNGDVFTDVDLGAVVALHRSRQARATIVLTPVDNPSAYGLVETDAQGRVLRFLEKPSADQIVCNTINAGIYVLEPDTLGRIPPDTVYSIERSYFPSLIEEGLPFVAHISRGYWLDIGTPDKYRQAHRDIMDGRFKTEPFTGRAGTALVAPDARIEDGATVEAPCFIGPGTVVKRGARIGAYTVLGHHCHVAEDAVVDGAILWSNCWVDTEARIGPALAGRHCHFGRSVDVGGDNLLGDKSVVTDHSRI